MVQFNKISGHGVASSGGHREEPGSTPGPQVRAVASQRDTKSSGGANVTAVKPLAQYVVGAGSSAASSASSLSQHSVSVSDSKQTPALPSATYRQADAHLQAFIKAEGGTLTAQERVLFSEFLEHEEYGLAYDIVIDLMNAGRQWPLSSLAHVKAAARAMGVEYPRNAHE